MTPKHIVFAHLGGLTAYLTGILIKPSANLLAIVTTALGAFVAIMLLCARVQVARAAAPAATLLHHDGLWMLTREWIQSLRRYVENKSESSKTCLFKY